MKKVLTLILTMTLLLIFCACGSRDSEKADVNLPNNGKKGPSKDVIQADLENALHEIPNAVLTGVSTEKSLTEDNRYEITLQVSAATNYADWQIDCDMSYTKYDQGWMLDDIDWNSKNYVIARTPDSNTLSDIANNTEVSVYYNDILPVENGVIDTRNVEGLGIIELSWTKTMEYLHAQCVGKYTTLWLYDETIDDWVFTPCDDGFGFYSDEEITPYQVDFTGTWDGIEISYFTWDGFNVKCGDIEAYFYKISGPPYNNESSYGWYTDGNRKYFQIQCGPLGTSLSIRSYGRTMTQYAYVSVTQELPLLAG